MRVLKELALEELGWKSPFGVYYGRKSNVVVKASHKNEKAISWLPRSNEFPSTKNVRHRSERGKKVRAEAAENTKGLDKRMNDKQKRMYKTVEYKSDDSVKVRTSYGGKKLPQREDSW